ncbi:MAG: L-arabinose isomerase [Oscillospiraceae bacterium]|nr:L-arabinose isomerase [Oscillospiraceae bacterium]
MKDFKQQAFWFITGSQFLYGEETLRQVAADSQAMVDGLNDDPALPCPLLMKGVVKTNAEFTELAKAANADDRCAGIVVWCHTFSPSKMWINGFSLLQKPYCHLHTQFNRNIPNEGIDMDFMNLNQSAHADREHGFIAARMRLARKIIVGYWEDPKVRHKLGDWMRTAYGVAVSRSLKIMRFGDNMREVAVTEGDKVGVQIQLGWQVNTTPVGELAEEIARVTEAEVDEQMAVYRQAYDIATDNLESIRYQAREELAMRRLFKRDGIDAYSNTFQDLYGLRQLPGLASQHLMAEGYGFGAEGDWKTSGMVAIVKAMGQGKPGGTIFMEDYTYDLTPGAELELGSHMLEVCPTIAAERPRIEVHPLGIGDREDPARLVFEGREGPAVLCSVIDMGGRLRMILHDIQVVKPTLTMPNLPVARVMWRPEPDLYTGCECWILAGGAHHSVLTQQVSAEQLSDWANIMGIECVHITHDTTAEAFKKELFWNDLAYKLS